MRGFLAVIENSFREIIDRKMFWVCLVASLLVSFAFFLIGFKKGEVEPEVTADNLQSIIMESFRQKRRVAVNVDSVQNGRAVLRIDPRVISQAPFLPDFFTPEKMKEVASYGGIQNFQFQADPWLIVEVNGTKEKVQVPLTVWNDYRGDAGVQTAQFGEGKNTFPDPIINRFSNPTVRKYLSGDKRWSSLDSGKIFILAELGFDQTLNPERFPGGSKITFFFGTYDFPLRGMNISDFVLTIQQPLIQFVVGWVGVIIAIIITANFIPGMLVNGGIELVLSKQISRWTLWLGRFFGASLFFALISAIFLVSSSFILYLQSGVFTGFLLLSWFPLMLVFFLVYSVSAFTGTFLENNLLSIIIALLAWMGATVLQSAEGVVEKLLVPKVLKEDHFLVVSLDVLGKMIPTPGNLKDLCWKWNIEFGNLSQWMAQVKMDETYRQVQELSTLKVLGTSMGWIVLFVVLSILLMYRKEF